MPAHIDFSWARFFRSVIFSWIKFGMVYLLLFTILLGTASTTLSNSFDVALFIDNAKLVIELGLFWLIVFVSFCVGWAAGIRKNGPADRTLPMLFLGGLIASFVPAMTAVGIMTDGKSFDPLTFMVAWGAITTIITLFISSSWFTLGFYDEWWY